MVIVVTVIMIVIVIVIAARATDQGAESGAMSNVRIQRRGRRQQ